MCFQPCKIKKDIDRLDWIFEGEIINTRPTVDNSKGNVDRPHHPSYATKTYKNYVTAETWNSPRNWYRKLSYQTFIFGFYFSFQGCRLAIKNSIYLVDTSLQERNAGSTIDITSTMISLETDLSEKQDISNKKNVSRNSVRNSNDRHNYTNYSQSKEEHQIANKEAKSSGDLVSWVLDFATGPQGLWRSPPFLWNQCESVQGLPTTCNS